VNGIEISRSADGCERKAEDSLFPDNEYFLVESVYSVMMMELGKVINADVRLVNVWKSWSDCMKNLGYSYIHPSSAYFDLEARSDDGPGDPIEEGGPPVTKNVDKEALRREEISVAKADYQCQQQTNYADIADAVKSDSIQIVVNKSEGAIEKFFAFKKQALKKAKEILEK
jgi:hypothetical protein